MLTRSKCMAALEAAGEKNWDMEKASDIFHPPTTVVATPDPILAQSEPRPPNPTIVLWFNICCLWIRLPGTLNYKLSIKYCRKFS